MRILVGLSVVLAICVGVAIRMLGPERLSALGSILAGAGSLLAVLWFSAGLRYQSKQLEEQRAQFAAQFHYLQESSRRDALLLAKGVLDKAEEKAIAHHGSISSINELSTEYMRSMEYFKPILESTNPREVIEACEKWLKREGAALTLLSGIKSAAEIYLRSIGVTDIDYSKSPEDFYFVYNSWFATQPFFNAFSGTAMLLSEFMVRLSPGRKAAVVAFFAANSKVVGTEVIRMEKLQTDIADLAASGHPVPAIASDL